MRVALVHESLAAYGGAERVLAEMQHVFPEAPLFTLEAAPAVARRFRPLSTSFLQRLPRWVRKRRFGLPLYPLAPETFDLSRYDVVLTSASAFVKGVVTRPGSIHICYCHSPTRFLWDLSHTVGEEWRHRSVRHGLLQLTLHGLRMWDQMAARRVDVFVANSRTTKERIAKYYRRDAVVLTPPVAGAHVHGAVRDAEERTIFLCVSRLSPYKRVDLVIETCTKLNLPLVVAGAGRDQSRLRRLAGPTVSLRGFVPEEELLRLYATARAVIFPSDDDFGLVPIEAMAAGTPVLALRRGGARETVVEGTTGEFFDEPVEELLADCIRRFLDREHAYDRAAIRAHAAQFSADHFRRELIRLVERTWEMKQRRTLKSAALV